MALKAYISIRFVYTVAVFFSIATVVVLSLGRTNPAVADTPHTHMLAAELRIVRDDLTRLNLPSNLPAAHIQGLHDRIKGGLGVLPWLLRQAGDETGAIQLRTFELNSTPSHNVLIKKLDRLIARHPLDISFYAPEHLTPTLRREAFSIHDAYCAGCHDETGQGDEDTALPARDLYLMARTGPPGAFLARLINGVKGDKTLLFSNPLTSKQIAALWHHYQQGPR